MPKIIRVFPRKTSATPDDGDVRIKVGPMLQDEADEVHISVSFTWDIPISESLAEQWRVVAPVKVGGPAYKDYGGEFIPGRYVKPGYVVTSRGCPNRCWFCSAWKNEGNVIRELPIHDGWNLLDNNILACSHPHRERVYKMLLRQSKHPCFTGGLEAKRLTEWDTLWLKALRPTSLFFAYDTPDDYAPLVGASNLLREYGLMKGHSVGCYVLIGYPNDTIINAQQRLIDTVRLGYFPQAMLYDRGTHMGRDEMLKWRRFQRSWANKIIVGVKFKQYSQANG